LAEHEALSTEAEEKAQFGVNDHTGFYVVAGPDCLEANGGEFGDPVGEDFCGDFRNSSELMRMFLSASWVHMQERHSL